MGRYEIYQGWITPNDPDEPEPECRNPWERVLHSDETRLYFPLQDPTLFGSFIRLGIRGEPSESKILSWVNEYGLLERAEDEKKGVIAGGMLNQAPITLQRFRAEVMQARSAMLLYHDLRRADSSNLEKRLSEMRENPTSQKVGLLSEMDSKLVSLYAGPKKFNWPLLLMARGLLEGFVEQRISSIQMSFWNIAPETTEEIGEWTNLTDEYVPTQSWRFPDLLSALYLQFYLVMVNAVPLRICEHPRCRTPFPATRTDKRFCTETCRSGARRHA